MIKKSHRSTGMMLSRCPTPFTAVLVVLAASLVTGLPGHAGAVQTPIYTVFSDVGASGDDIFTWNGVSLSSTSTNVPAPEGQYSMQMTAPTGAGWGIVNLQPDRVTPRAVDLSAYASSGELRFWAYCSTDNFILDIEHLDHSKEQYDFSTAFGGLFNQWVTVAIPLNLIQFPINDIFSPFEITLNQPGTCHIDDIRYVNPPTPNADLFNVTIRNISNQSPAGRISWPAGILPSGWARSDQYLDLELDSTNLGWGVQMYTQNTAPGANPKYVVSGSSNPAGLIDSSDLTATVPLAWSITAGTQTPAAAAPIAADPNTNPADPHAFPWLFIKDAATPAIPSLNTTAFQNGDPYVVVKNNVGIHFGQNGANNIPSFGAANPPNYIFFEANFGAALAQRTYQTNSIVVEFFTY